MNITQPLRAMTLGVGLLVAAALTAEAAPINGTIGFAGAYQAQDANGNLATLGNAVAIDFSPIDAGTSGSGAIFVTTSSGDLSGIGAMTQGSIVDLLFAPFGGPIADFFSAGGLTFDLESLEIVSQSDGGIILKGTGTMHYAGFEATSGTWGASFNDAGGGPNPSGIFSWSADIAPSAVPEPVSLAVFGAGLLGLGVVRRRRA